MVIHIIDHAHLSKQEMFPDTTRILAGSSALRLFDLGHDSDFSWPEFQDALNEELRTSLQGSFWPAILRACSESIKSRRLGSTHTLFRSPIDGRHYTPMLNRVEISGNNSAACHITFIQVAAGTQAEVRHKSVARIFTALNLAHRFRWEIIDRYSDLDQLQEFVEHHARTAGRGGNGVGTGNGSGLDTIWEAIRLLETESLNRGVYDEHALPADFGPDAEGRVRQMFPLWHDKRALLERAAADEDVATFAGVLAELDPINVEFISLASQRLGELVRTDADHGTG
jgi:hypothetical protein